KKVLCGFGRVKCPPRIVRAISDRPKSGATCADRPATACRAGQGTPLRPAWPCVLTPTGAFAPDELCRGGSPVWHFCLMQFFGLRSSFGCSPGICRGNRIGVGSCLACDPTPHAEPRPDAWVALGSALRNRTRGNDCTGHPLAHGLGKPKFCVLYSLQKPTLDLPRRGLAILENNLAAAKQPAPPASPGGNRPRRSA